METNNFEKAVKNVNILQHTHSGITTALSIYHYDEAFIANAKELGEICLEHYKDVLTEKTLSDFAAVCRVEKSDYWLLGLDYECGFELEQEPLLYIAKMRKVYLPYDEVRRKY